MSLGGSDHNKGALGGLFGKDSQNANYSVHLNVTPLMDVMSNILFFLLASFGATVVAVLPTTVPVRSTDTTQSDKPPDEEKVDVTIRADASGLNVNAASPNIDPAILKQLGAKLPKRDGEYDHERLTATLKLIKEKYPASKQLVLVPDDDLKYEVIVKIMDAARDYKAPTGHRIELFPEVVLSSIVK
jgi:biopolymer transport protein ExbD